MCPLLDGTPVDAATTNPKFLYKEIDDTTVGKLGLANVDTVSGTSITNAQREHNSIASFVGKVVNTIKNALPSWATSNRGLSTDNLKERIEAIDSAFNPSTGHKHTGAAGDAPPVSAVDLASVSLQGFFIEGATILGAAGLSDDITSYLPGEIPSTSQTVEGVVVNPPFNKVTLRDSNYNEIEDALGNPVYGRVTESASVWTLTYYSLVGAVETPYSFSPALNLKWFYQKLYNPITNSPVYSPLAVIPSDNVTADVITATTTLQGKTLLASASPAAISATASAGTPNATVANSDHTHAGAHSVAAYSVVGPPLLGDIEFEAGSGVSLSYNAGRLKIDVSAPECHQEVPTGTINGVNDTFLLSESPDAACLQLFLDDMIIPNANYSLIGPTITITTPSFIPTFGQTLYAFYLLGSTTPPAPPPSGTEHVEYRTLSGGEITAKQITLAGTPASAANTILDWIDGGGQGQRYAVDFSVSGMVLSWSGLGLDGILVAGDVLRVVYIS